MQLVVEEKKNVILDTQMYANILTNIRKVDRVINVDTSSRTLDLETKKRIRNMRNKAKNDFKCQRLEETK